VKITFVGAGSVVFTKNLLQDLSLYPEFNQVEISLMDIDEIRLKIAQKVAEEIKEKRNKNWKINAYLELGPAIKNSDYVINTVQIGGIPATYVDFDIPEKYGIPQTIGDTHGVGGVMRFLRTAPFLKNLVREIENSAPSSLLINFTNPMSMNQWYINSITDIKNIGLCHSIPNTIEQIASYINVPVQEINYKVAGINHMAWVLILERNKENLYPILFKAMEKEEIWKKDPVRFEILRNFGYFVTESSEHNAEYVPYFIKDESLVKKLNIPIREYIRRVELNEKVFETYVNYYIHGREEFRDLGDKMLRDYFGGEEEEKVEQEEKSKEYAIQIIHAIETNTPTLIYGIVKNNNLITNYPSDCMVEVPCLVDKNGISPTFVGEIPSQLASLNLPHINVQRLAVESALSGKRDYVYYAVSIDPLVSSLLSLDKIRSMVDELLSVHKEYLGDLLKQERER